MEKEKIEEIAVIAAKGIFASIPYFGSTLTSIWSDIQAKRKQERLMQFNKEFANELELIKENLNTDYIFKADFLDVFETTVKYVIDERIDDKRQLFKNILINGMTDKVSDFDKTEKYLKIVNEMSNLELFLLKIFVNPVKYNEDNGEIISNPNKIHQGAIRVVTYMMNFYIVDILRELLSEFSENDILEALYFLERNRLVNENITKVRVQTNGHPIDILKDKLSAKGKDFVLYILKKDDPIQ